jgi:MYXO-CTERM domain-containing protein
MKKIGTERLRHFMAAALAIGVLVLSTLAWAAGRIEWKSKSLKESGNHSWTVEVSIFMTKAPDVATLPMRFSFQPVVYYERALMDGKDGPQERKVPLEGKPPLVESVDVGFLDPGNGQVQKRTKFSFSVNRGHGFEAGEYDVTVRDGRTDSAMGAVTHLVFDGENEVIDRRAVVFSGEKKEKAKEGDDKKDDAPKKKQLTEDDPGFWEGGPKKTDAEKNEEVENKGGCGCRVGGEAPGNGVLGAGLAGTLLGLAGLRRRVRSASRRTPPSRGRLPGTSPLP